MYRASAPISSSGDGWPSGNNSSRRLFCSAIGITSGGMLPYPAGRKRSQRAFIEEFVVNIRSDNIPCAVYYKIGNKNNIDNISIQLDKISILYNSKQKNTKKTVFFDVFRAIEIKLKHYILCLRKNSLLKNL